MTDTPPFEDLLTLIEERSAALHAAAEAAPSLDGRVPGCPDWTLDDLVHHISSVQRFWSVAVTQADPSGPPNAEQRGETEPPGDLLDWFAESTELLLTALRAAGPDTPVWAWWADSGAPLTSGAVARHQVQEAAVHASDAQETIGKGEPLPAAVAVDGVAEFIQVGLASRGPWPNRPARLTLVATEGPTWTIDLTPAGATLNPPAAGDPVTTVHAPASDLVLALYGRVPFTNFRVEGDPTLLTELNTWSVMD